VSAFFAALQFLTVFPRPKRMEYRGSELGPAVIFFPVIGSLLGVILVLANAVLELFASAELSSVALVAILTVLTRGLHLDGLADTFDGIGAGGDRQRVLNVMEDSRSGAFGVIAIVLVLFFKISAIASIEGERWRALLAALILGRWAMALLGYRSQAAKTGLGATLISHLKTKHVVLATLITLALISAVLRGIGIAVMIWIAVFVLASKKYFHQRLGGLTGDTFGAVGELSETSVLVVLALGVR
jgi:adenosylcobinamide-GDP ribazoletransferase